MTGQIGTFPVKVACILLTLNEEPRIEECLNEWRPHVDFILIVDSQSTDNTVKIAKKIADKVIVRPFSGSFAEEKNFARKQVPKDCGWIAWADVDEKWDPGFLKRLKWLLEHSPVGGVIRLPRIVLPDPSKSYPDYQVRVFPNSRDIEWRGKTHEIPYYIPENTRLDNLDAESREKKLPIMNADEFPILHLPRRTDMKRSWW
jgi:glycosyltransferase involved in cell wall biosynthesis